MINKKDEVLIPEGANQLTIFQGNKIRSVKHQGEWWYSVVDIISVLTESKDARSYWKVLKSRLLSEGADELVTKCNQLKLTAADGKERLTDVMKVEDILRLVQSVPSPKSESPTAKEIFPKKATSQSRRMVVYGWSGMSLGEWL